MTFGNANFGKASFTLNPPPPPPEAPREVRRPEHADRAADAERAERAERDFENALKQELERKQAPMLPLPLPMMALQAKHPPSDEAPIVDAASGVMSEASRSAASWMRAAIAGAPVPQPTTAGVQPDLEVAPVAAPAHDAVETVQVMVESHLPPIQPLAPVEGSAQPVHLVEFPQVVTGTVRQMVKDNQPVTQLDFEISPPHVGPVNLQVQLQNGAVNVQLVALTMQAKQSLESQINNISSILQAHNFTPGQIKVVTAAGGKAGAGSAGQKGDQPNFNFFSGGRRRSAGEQDAVTVGGA